MRPRSSQTVARVNEIPPGRLHGVAVGGHPVLLAQVDGAWHAVADRCGDSPLPLRFSALEGHVITCSWHGCRYDVRTGHRLDRPGASLAVYPVSLSGDEVQVAVTVIPVGEPT